MKVSRFAVFISAIAAFAVVTAWQFCSEDDSAFATARKQSSDRFLESKLGSTRYQTFGDPDKPAIVLIHGFNGYLVPSGDPEALAYKVTLLLKYDSLRQQLGDQARRFAQDRIAPGFQERDRTRVLDRTLMRAMGEMGFIAPELPEAFGGQGLGQCGGETYPGRQDDQEPRRDGIPDRFEPGKNRDHRRVFPFLPHDVGLLVAVVQRLVITLVP